MGDKIDRMSDRLAGMVRELVSRPDYASGRRRYPRTVTADDAADIAEAMEEEVDRGAAARADAVKRQLQVIACTSGCNACCEQPIMVTLPEAHVVARWLARPENAAARDGFLSRYPAWRARVGAKIDALADAAARDDDAAAARLHLEARGLCPFNDQGSCTVYPARPIVCRNAHALETAKYCDMSSEEEGKVMAFPPLDEFIAKAHQVLWAAHHALPGSQRRRRVALADAVYQLLTR